MFLLNEADMVFIPIIMGIVNIFKNIGLNKKFAPLISICIGVVLCLLFSKERSLSDRMLKGIVLGLSASGFYTNGKSFIGKRK